MRALHLGRVESVSERRVPKLGRWLAGRSSELRADILSIYEKNPICVTRDATLRAGRETKREKG